MREVLVVLPVEDRHKQKLEAAGQDCVFRYVPDREVTAEQVAAAEVILGNVPAELIGASPRLKLLQLNTAGADAYIRPGVLDRGTALTNATGAYGKAVSEHALAMTLMLQKKLHLYRDEQRHSHWSEHGQVSSLSDATVLVVGLGDIGLRYARMVKALGAYVIGLRRRTGDCPEGVDELHSAQELDGQLGRADVVVSFLPGSPGTRHVYGAERFAAMKSGAIFINCGRGSAVDQEALLRALREGPLAAAGADVTDPEPLPADDPLWLQENMLITPHVSGYYHLPETFERVVDIAAENLGAYCRGETLKNLVDFETGYRR